MQIVVSNVSASPVWVSDLHCSIAAGGSITTTRYLTDLSRMVALQGFLEAGTLTMATTPSAAELAANVGMLGLGTAGAVPSTQLNTQEFTLRYAFAAGGGGSADDKTIFAVNAVPYKFRVMNMYAVVATAVSAKLLQLRTALTGGGTLLAECSGGTAGYEAGTSTVTASQVVTPGSAVGLILHRTDSGIAGEVFVKGRLEQ